MQNFIITALLVLGISTAANASGFRAEVHTGWMKGSVDEQIKDDNKDNDINRSGSGLNFGGAIGYDFDVSDNFFLGAEVGLDGSTAKACIGEKDDEGGRDCVAAGRDFSTVIRAGWKNERTKLYVLGGYTNLKTSIKLPDYEYDEGEEKLDLESHTYDGWRMGAGWQQALNDSGKLYFKMEYRFSKYSGSKKEDPDTKIVFEYLGGKTHSIIAGIGYQF